MTETPPVELTLQPDTHPFAALPEGFYWLRHPAPEFGGHVSLVRLYTALDSFDVPHRGIGFGHWDGYAFVPLGDLVDGCTLTPAVKDPPDYDLSRGPEETLQ